MTFNNFPVLLQACEQELTAIYDNVPGIVFYIAIEPDGEFRFVSVSREFLTATGLSREQVVGSLVRDVIPPPSRDVVLNHYREAIRSRQTVRWEEESVYPAGQRHGEVAVTPLYDASGLATHLIGIVHDITERKRLEEEALRESEERLRLATEAGRMFAYSWDPVSDVIERSGESKAILGVSNNEAATGVAVSAMVHHDDRERLQAALANLTVENPTLGITYRIIRPDGAVIWVQRNSRGYFDAQGKLKRVVGMVLDVTERKRAKEALAEMTRRLIAAQEQERARIGRELHDDVNQRIAMLSVKLEQLQQSPAELQSRVQELRKELRQISDDVRAISHDLHSSKLEYLGAVAGMKSWCREAAERYKSEVTFRSDFPSNLSLDVGLPLFRVLQEAVNNSIRHSGEKQVEVQLLERSGEIHLTIRDSGRGFDVETAMQGNGLGLTSMKERVRLVNGTMTIDSKPMGGTTIRVRVPFEPEPVSQRKAI